MSDLYKWVQKVPGVLTFFLVIALGVTLANLLWMIVTPAPSVAQAANRVNPGQVASLGRQENYGKLIADQHLFGAIPKTAPTKIKKAAPVKVVKPTKAPVNLNLKLHGIISSKNEAPLNRIPFFEAAPNPPKYPNGIDITNAQGQEITKKINALYNQSRNT